MQHEATERRRTPSVSAEAAMITALKIIQSRSGETVTATPSGGRRGASPPRRRP